ncbi:MAG: right-handed parallel beta-helix repeat-containing protein, partial [Phycisphaerales bacterium]
VPMMRIENYIRIAACSLLLLVSGARADIVTVGPNGEDYTTINAAINASADGDEIVVSAGVYEEQLAIQDQRRTIRAAGNGEVIVSGQNTYTPVRVGGVNSHIILDSITIRDGFSMFDAGGISIHGSAFVEMNNCVIEDNHAGELGGGIYCESYAVIRNCLIRNNTAGGSGGGAATNILFSGEARFVDCVFENNQAVHGGAFSSSDSGELAVLERCRIVNNSASGRGGAIAVLGFNSEEAIVKAQSCIFENNTADEHGGAVWVSYNDMFNAVACLFARNEAQLYGGAISTDEWVNALNCTFADNRTVAAGVPDTFSGNRSEAFFVIRSSIITNEHALSWRGQGNFAVDESLLPAGDDPDGGFDNIHDDPLYRDPDGLDADPDNDFDILAGSPVIDRADALEAFNGIDMFGVQSDLLGRNRLVDDPDTVNEAIVIWDGVMDWGAFEYNPESEPVCLADFTNDGVLDFFDVSAFLTAFNAGCP